MYKYLIKTSSPKSPLLPKTDNPAFLSANKEVEELLCRSSSDNSNLINLIKITALDDKRQITALLTISKSGELLPPQIIYKGTTEQCHPKYQFPKSWNIYHSENHWSTTNTMLQYIEKVLILYVSDKRDELDLPLKHPALAIFDVFSAHRNETVLDALYRANIKVVFVPARCTDNLQPLDLKVNKIYKDLLKSMFQNWYADEMGKNLRKDKKI